MRAKVQDPCDKGVAFERHHIARAGKESDVHMSGGAWIVRFRTRGESLWQF
jgi:hypothetical protein